MDAIKNKSYKQYDKLSRYNNFPYYYHTLDNKYIYGTTAWLNDETPYTLYTVQTGDTIDKLSLYYYNTPTYYWIICDFNRISDPYMTLEKGMKIKIPSISGLSFDTYH